MEFNICTELRKLNSFCSTMLRKEKIVWDPWDNFTTGLNRSKYAIVLLNTPINLNFKPNFVLNLWNQAVIRILVDGGTDRWLTWLKVNNCDNVASPELVTGDMDSVSNEALEHFRRQPATNVITTADQDETDFTKSLRVMKDYITQHNLKIDTVIVLADTSGRFDQILANVNTLYKARHILPGVKVIKLAADSLTWLLSEGNHSINIPVSLRECQTWCSLIPIGAPRLVTTSGLKWNLTNSTLEFGKCVSTSNTYNGDPVVTVQTDGPIVWSMGIDSIL